MKAVNVIPYLLTLFIVFFGLLPMPGFCGTVRVMVLFDEVSQASSGVQASGVISAASSAADGDQAAQDHEKENRRVENQRGVLSRALGLIKPVPGRSADAAGLFRRISGLGQGVSAQAEDEDPLNRCRWNWGYLINGAALNIDEADIDSLRAVPGVRAVVRDNKVKQCLSESVPIMNADDVWTYRDQSGSAIDGSGVTVGIVDTGVDYTHPALGGGLGTSYKVKGGYDYVNFDWNPMDDNGHGTHVAGIIAAKGNVTGVAPGASIMAYKVLDSRGEGYSSDVVQAIQDAVKAGCKIINVSLGTSTDTVLTQTAISAVRAGSVVCAAAGNEGPAPYTINSPGDGREVICVAACRKDLVIWDGSSRGPASNGETKPDITAPGKSIYSTYLNKNYAYLTGTSMATPHVTGMCALLLQSDSTLTPTQVKDRICNNAFDLGYVHTTQGYGLADCKAAVLNGSTAVPPAMDIISPGASGLTADTRITIQWTDEDPDSSASISLYYDTNSSGYDGVLIASAISEDSSTDYYSWDVSGLPEGVYYIYYTISDGINTAVSGYGPGAVTVSHPPTLEMTLPQTSGAVVSSSVDVAWTDQDTDDDAQVTIWVDRDRLNHDGTMIAGPFSEDIDGIGADNTTIDVSSLASGIWYVYGKIDDGRGNVAYSYAPGSFILNTPPQGAILSPSTDLLTAGGSIAISFTFSDADDQAVATLSYTGSSSGIIAQNIAESTETQLVQWDLSSVPGGAYQIVLTVQDGYNTPLTIVSTGQITLNRPPSVSLSTPAQAGAKADTLFYITYTLSDGDSQAWAELFWSSSQDGSDSVGIAAALAEGTVSVPWDTSQLSRGLYYIHIKAYDGVNPVQTAQAAGTVLVDHAAVLSFPDSGVRVAGSTLEVSFNLVDDSGTASLALYIDLDGQGADGTLLGLLEDLSSGDHTVVYPFAQTQRGAYWIYGVAADGVTTSQPVYAPEPVYFTPSVNICDLRVTNLSSSAIGVKFQSLAGSAPRGQIYLSTGGQTLETAAQEFAPGLYNVAFAGLSPGTAYNLRILDSSHGFSEVYPSSGALGVSTSSVTASDFSGHLTGQVESGDQTCWVCVSAFDGEKMAFLSGFAASDGSFSFDLGQLVDRNGQRVIPVEGMPIEIEVVKAGVQGLPGTSLSRVYLPALPRNGDAYVVDAGILQLSQGYKAMIDIRRGWNLIALPREPAEAYPVSRLMESSNSVMAALWSAQEQRYKTAILYEGSVVGTDFEVHAGACVFLRASAGTTVTVGGLGEEKTRAVKFLRGFNFHGFSKGVSLPDFFRGTYTTHGLLRVLNTIGAVYSWDGSDQKYHSSFLIEQNSDPLGEDFTFPVHSGAIIKCFQDVYYLED